MRKFFLHPLSVVFIFSGFSFFSCSNFLQGSDIKNQIAHTVDVSKIKSDTDAPVLRSLNISKAVNGQKSGNYLLKGEYDSDSSSSAYMTDLAARADDYHVSQLYVDCTSFEKTSAVKYVQVTQSLVAASDAGVVASKYNSVVTKEAMKQFPVKQGESSFGFAFDLTSSLPDGMVKLEFQLVDYFENKSFDTAVYYVNKDTTLTTGNLSFENDDAIIDGYTFENFNEAVKTVTVKGFESDSWYDFGNKQTVTDSASSLTKKVRFWNEGSEKKELILDDTGEFVSDLSSSSAMNFEIELSDRAGNVSVQSLAFPAVPSFDGNYVENSGAGPVLTVFADNKKLEAYDYVHICPVKINTDTTTVRLTSGSIDSLTSFVEIKYYDKTLSYDFYSFTRYDRIENGISVYFTSPVTKSYSVKSDSAKEINLTPEEGVCPSYTEIAFSTSWNQAGSGTLKLTAETLRNYFTTDTSSAAGKTVSLDKFEKVLFKVIRESAGMGYSISYIPVTESVVSQSDSTKIKLSGDCIACLDDKLTVVLMLVKGSDVYYVQCSEDPVTVTDKIQLPSIMLNEPYVVDEYEGGSILDYSELKYLNLFHCIEGDAEFVKNISGNYEITYYYVPVSEGVITVEQADDYPSYVCEYSDIENYELTVPLFGLKPGSYRIYAKVYDTAGNWVFKNVTTLSNFHGAVSDFMLEHVSADSSKETCRISEAANKYCMIWELNAAGGWNTDWSPKSFGTIDSETGLYSGEVQLTTSNPVKRICIFDYYKWKIVSNYVYHIATTGSRECNTTLYDNSGLFTVFTDNKVFVHALVSMTDFGEDVSAWERFAEEVNPELIETTKNYQFDVSKVQDGFYYKVIAYDVMDNVHVSSTYQK